VLDLELPAMVTSDDFWEALYRREKEKAATVSPFNVRRGSSSEGNNNGITGNYTNGTSGNSGAERKAIDRLISLLVAKGATEEEIASALGGVDGIQTSSSNGSSNGNIRGYSPNKGSDAAVGTPDRSGIRALHGSENGALSATAGRSANTISLQDVDPGIFNSSSGLFDSPVSSPLRSSGKSPNALLRTQSLPTGSADIGGSPLRSTGLFSTASATDLGVQGGSSGVPAASAVKGKASAASPRELLSALTFPSGVGDRAGMLFSSPSDPEMNGANGSSVNGSSNAGNTSNQDPATAKKVPGKLFAADNDSIMADHETIQEFY
jgi:hypothetical protein